MSYIQSSEHFYNYIASIIRNSNGLISHEDIINIDLYEELKKQNLVDSFTWAIKENPLLLVEHNFLQWMKSQTLPQGIFIRYEKNLVKEFIDKINDLASLSGVYGFYNSDNICLYIGVSVNLGERIASSFHERFHNYHIPIYLRYFLTETKSDAYVLETVAISKIKPVYNTTGKYGDELTLDIGLPEFSKPILCNCSKEVK